MIQDGPKANPLIDRPALEKEAFQRVREISLATGEDPAVIVMRASLWKGSAKVNPASMSDDRLIYTVMALRKMQAPPPEKTALQIATEWVNENGGEMALAKRLIAWIAAERYEGESDSSASQRWAEGCPPGVLAYLGRALYFEKKRRAG